MLNGATRRRIEPDNSKRTVADNKGASEKLREQAKAINAIKQSLRHAGVLSRQTKITVQREPFDSRGQKAVEFAHGTRFSKHAMWHASIEFSSDVSGPLCIGDGRFLGLGLLKPASCIPSAYCFRITSEIDSKASAQGISNSVRKAVMGLVSELLGSKQIPVFFSGHNFDGTPSKSDRQPHLAFACDLDLKRVFIFPPSLINRKLSPEKPDHLTL